MAAGIHDIAIALMAGARVMIKTASAEPIFAEFARTLAESIATAERVSKCVTGVASGPS